MSRGLHLLVESLLSCGIDKHCWVRLSVFLTTSLGLLVVVPVALLRESFLVVQSLITRTLLLRLGMRVGVEQRIVKFAFLCSNCKFISGQGVCEEV